jgi:hypothetical protein
MCLPSRLKMIPDWFEHQIRGTSISFWFRKQIPFISFIILLLDSKPCHITFEIKVSVFFNGNKHCLILNLLTTCFGESQTDHTYLCDLMCYSQIMKEVDQATLTNEWSHVEVELIHNISDDPIRMSLLTLLIPQFYITKLLA